MVILLSTGGMSGGMTSTCTFVCDRAVASARTTYVITFIRPPSVLTEPLEVGYRKPIIPIESQRASSFDADFRGMAIKGIVFNVDLKRILRIFVDLFLNKTELLLNCAVWGGVIENALSRDWRGHTTRNMKHNRRPSRRLWRRAEAKLRVGKCILNWREPCP